MMISITSIVKPNRKLFSLLFSALLIAAIITSGATHAQASDTTPSASVGAAFTYQGRLTNNGSPANGQYDLRFNLYDALSGGNNAGGPITLSNQTVSNGIFTVSLDFSYTIFQGEARYLQIEVAPSGGSFTLLSPRQPLSPVPYALNLRPGAVIIGSSPANTILAANNQGENGTAISGSVTSGTTAKAVSGTSTDGYGGYFFSSNGIGVSSYGADGISSIGWASDGNGVKGTANNGTNARGVTGISTSGTGVYGTSTGGYGGKFVSSAGSGVYASSTSGIGGTFVSSASSGIYASSTNGFAGNFLSTTATGVNVSGSNGLYSVGNQSNGVGLWGAANNGTTAKGVYGTSTTGYGVSGTSTASGGTGVLGTANVGASAAGVSGTSSSGTGTEGISTASGGTGLFGQANSGASAKGVYGSSTNGEGGHFVSSTGTGVYAAGSSGIYAIGTATDGYGIKGVANGGDFPNAVYGSSTAIHGTGVYGEGYGYGVYGKALTSGGLAAVFDGNVLVYGNCCAAGESYNRIDNPLDPANSYLNQSLIQSPDMLSLIDGNAPLDSNGEAAVSLPDWFAASNTDFRYSLTAVGAPGPNLYISQEIAGSTFHIAGGAPNGKVSWKVTGIRTDPYAVNHPIQVEQAKPAEDAGKYLYPEDYDQPDSKKIDSTLAKPYAKP